MTLVWRPGFQQWDPSLISTALWLDAADSSTVFSDLGVTPATDGQAVSQWNDKSGNGRHATQATEANRPIFETNTLNGKSVLDYGSTINNKFLSGSFSGSLGRWYGVADWFGGATFNDYNALVVFNQATSADVVQGIPGSTSLFNAETLFLNGASTASANVLGTMQNPFIFVSNSAPNASRTLYRVGSDANPNRGWRGYIAEVIFTPAVLDAVNRQKMEGYLAHKWGLTANLPADHPYKTNAPAP